MNKVYLDVESVGLKGPLLTVQYSINREEVKFVRVDKDKEEMDKVFSLLNDPSNIIIGYNLGFDLWKLYQHYHPSTRFMCFTKDLYIDVLTRPPFCIYNVAGGKSVVNLTKIPKIISEKVEAEVISKLKKLVPNFIDIVVKHQEVKENKELVSLKFIPKCSNKLKSLISKIQGIETIKTEEAFILPEQVGFKENKAVPIIMDEEKQQYEQLYKLNIEMLDDPERSKKAIEYSTNDIKYLFILEDFLNKYSPSPDPTEDENQICVHTVAYTKYRGFSINLKEVETNIVSLEREQKDTEQTIPINLQSTKERKDFLQQKINIPVIGTDKKKLQLLLTCDDQDVSKEAKVLIRKMLKYKPNFQRLRQLKVIKDCKGRVYPDFRVVGTSSQRMAGTGGFNFQGISREAAIRKCIKTSMGGDFSNLEVNIAAVYSKDKDLENDLKNGIDLHTMTATMINKELANLGYEEVQRIKEDKDHPKHKEIKEIRNTAKSVNFAILYFCEMQKISEILKITPEEATVLMEEGFFKRYAGLKRTRERFKDYFCTADFGSWSKGSVGEMRQEIVDLFGNKRYVVFERTVAKLFWENSTMFDSILTSEEKTMMVVRQKIKGKQKMSNALKSACLGAASAIQKSVMRSLGNFPNQSSGSHLTKILMARIFLKFSVPVMNIHDEIIIPEEYASKYQDIKQEVESFLRDYQTIIPTLKMDFVRMNSWAEKD